MKTWAEFNEAVLFKGLTEWCEPGHPDLDDPDYRFEFGDVEWHEIGSQTTRTGTPRFNPDFLFRVVEDYGGEGQGEQYWFVIEVELADRILHYKIEGYYQSYDGGYYESIRQVTPRDKVVTVWT